jgi:small conductance mechanosensitive channel
VILIVVTRIGIAIFENYFAPNLGLGYNHILIGETMITVIISFVVISSIRGALKRLPTKIPAHLTASISFFSIIIISLIASLILLYLWGVQLQTILVGGGVAAIVVGLGVSTIMGNVLSGAIMLTTFPAKIGDSILIVNDNIHGIIQEISALYTKINTADGTEYLVPNSAIIQGNIRILKEAPMTTHLPYVVGDKIELSNGSEKYSGIVIMITSRFTTILDGDTEILVGNGSILGGSMVIKKSKTGAAP